ncbi:hypothetical protein KAJ27_24600 [bacterium]|nr:hypothetical protein [bacterium]
MDKKQNIEKLADEIQNQKMKIRKGWLFSVLSLIALIDIPLPPLPPVVAVFVFIVCISIAYNSFKEGYYLPVNQCLKLSRYHNNRLSPSIITMELGISIHQAKKIIQILCREGLAVISDKSVDKGEVMYRIIGLDDNMEKNIDDVPTHDTQNNSVNQELIEIKKKIIEKKSDNNVHSGK